MSVRLFPRENYIVYTGKPQRSLQALEPIAPYIADGASLWFWNNAAGQWDVMQTPGIPVYDRDIMVPFSIYGIEMAQEIVWDFGPAGVPPESANLYVRETVNWVVYSGPQQPVLDGFASILDYLDIRQGIWRWDNANYKWQLVLAYMYGEWSPREANMMPFESYTIKVTQDCRWQFEVVVPAYSGTISRKELEYNESRGAIPVR